jgi:1,2-diacylglycerol 3-beta-galactosyltransferase
LTNTEIITDTTISENGEQQQQQLQLNSKQNQQRQRRPLKILFLSSDTGGGHRASAEALAAQFCHHYPNTTYDLLDCWTDIPSSWPYYTIKDTYKSFSSTPWKWRALYHVSNTAIYTKLADAHSYYMTEENVRCAMERYNPDVVVSVHPTMNYVPLLALRKVSKMKGKDIPFFTVVTE